MCIICTENPKGQEIPGVDRVPGSGVGATGALASIGAELLVAVTDGASAEGLSFALWIDVSF